MGWEQLQTNKINSSLQVLLSTAIGALTLKKRKSEADQRFKAHITGVEKLEPVSSAQEA